MRSIIFRGKSSMTGEWVFGSLLQSPDGMNHIIPNDIIPIQVDRTTVGQFIDKKDSRHVSIYEKDVLFDPEDNRFYVVQWDDINATFFMKNLNKNKSNKKDYDFAEFEMFICNQLYVVGNIIDNSDSCWKQEESIVSLNEERKKSIVEC